MDTQRELIHNLSSRRWAIISAEKSDRDMISNTCQSERLKKMLHEDGYSFDAVVGVYSGVRENSFIVWDITSKAALTMAIIFTQESVLVNGALLFTSGDSIPTDLENITFDNDLKDNYTEIEVGRSTVKFQIPLKEV